MSTFIHNEFIKLKDWKPYKSHNKNYKTIIKTSDKDYNLLAEDLKKAGLVTFSDRLIGISKKKSTSLKGFHKERKELKNKFSFRGYESLRLFSHEFGRAIFALILSFLFTLIVVFPELVKQIKNVFIIGSFGFMGISCFWVTHSLIPSEDLPKWSYKLSYIISAIVTTIISFIIIYFIKSRITKKEKNQKDLEKLIVTGNELFSLNKNSL